jgi:triacylglycerol lipase
VPVTDVRIALAHEARAMLRMAALLPRDWQRAVPGACGPGDDVVVLVHGLLATAGVMRPLRQGIEVLECVHTATFSYPPGLGIDAIARELGRVLDSLGQEARIHLFGHSMGGLAVRWFVQQVRHDPRIVQTISVAAPFKGARGAFLMPGQAGRDIRAGSELLARLHASASRGEVPHLTILGAADTAVPVETAFPIGDRVVIPHCGHNALLFHPAVREAVVARVLASRSTPVTVDFSPAAAPGSVIPLRA